MQSEMENIPNSNVSQHNFGSKHKSTTGIVRSIYALG
jgi:hypothetical protein